MCGPEPKIVVCDGFVLHFPSRHAGKLCPPTCTHPQSPTYHIPRTDKSYIYSKHKDISQAIENICSSNHNFSPQLPALKALINKCNTDNQYKFLGECLSHLGQEHLSVRSIVIRILKILAKREHLLTFVNGRAINLLLQYLHNNSAWNVDFARSLSSCCPLMCELLTECHNHYGNTIPQYVSNFLTDIISKVQILIGSFSFDIQNISNDAVPQEDPRY